MRDYYEQLHIAKSYDSHKSQMHPCTGETKDDVNATKRYCSFNAGVPPGANHVVSVISMASHIMH